MDEIKMEAPILIIFAEYLGYISPFTETAEKWCEGTIPMPHMQMVMMTEAKCILRQMKKDYTVEQMHEFYNEYDELILEDYKKRLKSLITVPCATV